MPGALFSRQKVWVANEVLTYSDLNLEFNNILNNLEADTLGGYSSTVALMQTQTSPGALGSESLSASVSDELERIRFVIARIVGKTYWYEAPAKNLSSSYVKARHIFAPTSTNDDPIQGLGAEAYRAGIFGGVDSYLTYATQGKFSVGSLTNYTIFPNLLTLDPRCIAGSLTYCFWMKGFSVNETIMINPVLGLRAYVNASGFIQVDIQKATTTGANKEVASVVGTTSVAGSTSFRHVIISYKLSGTTSDVLRVYLDGVLNGTPITGVAIHGNVPTLNETTVLFGNISKTTSISTNMNALPETLGWTKTSTGGTASVSGGVLTAVNAAAQTQYWSRTPPSTGAGAVNWVEFKIRIKSTSSLNNTYTGDPEQAFSLIVRNGAQGMRLSISAHSCTISNSNALAYGTNGHTCTFNHNFMDWTHVIFNMDSTASITSVVVNGRPAGLVSGTQTDAAAAALIFGKTTTGNHAASYDLEYINSGVGFAGLATATPVTNQTISDFAVLEGVLTDTGLISSLQSFSPFALFGEEIDKRINYPVNRSAELGSAGITVAAGGTSTLPASQPQIEFHSDGITPLKLSFDFDATIAAVAGSFTGNVWLRIAGDPTSGYPGAVFESLYQNVSQSALTTAGIVDGVTGQRQYNIPTIPAGVTLPLSGTVSFCSILPAGTYSVRPQVYVHTGSVSAVFRRFELTCTQG